VINRIIDNAAVSAASVLRRPVTTARHQALAHRARPGATVFGVDGSYSAEWAAWANGVAVRELDYHDTFLAAEYSHPGDNIPPLVAVAQQLGVRGNDLIRGLATAYEIQIDLVKGICLHEHKIDHVGERYLDVVGQPVDEHHVAFQQARMHRPGRNRVPVRHGGAEHAEQKKKHDEPVALSHP